MTKKDRSLFRVASNIADMSNHRYKLGAVVYYKHRIISSGCNSSTNTDRIQAILDKQKYGCECCGKLHAESAALIPLIKRHIQIKGAEIYVVRKKHQNTYGMARPCSSCMKLIKECGISKIHYTTDDGYSTEELIY